MSFPEQTAPPPSGGEPAEKVKVEPLAFASRRSKSQRSESELHICPTCGSDLVYPTDWAPANERSWAVNLRCPDCEWLGSGTYAQEVVDRFDIELDRGTDMLIEDLARLMRANMEDEIERFVSALYADHVLAEDF
jgi:predicted RNA-binding Zn-ribbon protein involved in translation (DUF1610 family)